MTYAPVSRALVTLAVAMLPITAQAQSSDFPGDLVSSVPHSVLKTEAYSTWLTVIGHCGSS